MSIRPVDLVTPKLYLVLRVINHMLPVECPVRFAICLGLFRSDPKTAFLPHFPDYLFYLELKKAGYHLPGL